MMDGRFSADLTGAMALIPGAVPAEPFIRTPGLVARAADGVFTARGPQDRAARLVADAEAATAEAEGEAAAAAEGEMAHLPDPVPVAQAVMPPPAPPVRADLAEERAQARREVLAEQAELSAARAALQHDARLLAMALARIAQPPAADLEALTAHLGQAVAHLAAQRAGQAIDADAAPFARRIAGLARQITETLSQVTLRLHPDDAARVAALLQGACPPDLADLADLAGARLCTDPALRRGDVILHTPTLRLEDLIAPDPWPGGSEAGDV